VYTFVVMNTAFHNPDLSIELIETNDQPQLFALMQRIFPAAYGHAWKDQAEWYLDYCFGNENFNREIESPNSDYYFVYHQTRRCGILRLEYAKPFPDQPNLPALKLHRLYLGAEVHGKGIAQELMAFAEQQAQQRQLKLIWLEALTTQQQALRFYTKMGYTTGSIIRLPHEGLYDAYRDMYRMWKRV
jgi:ribosomal protein S18 acetylase RimI-like enzyme